MTRQSPSDGMFAAPWRGRPRAVWVLLGLHVFLGVRALVGGSALILVPSGELVGLSVAVLGGTPFQDFLLPGLFLFVVLGVGSLLVAAGVYTSQPWAWVASAGIGVVLVCWVVVEASVVGIGARLQYLNVVQGLVMILVANSKTVRRDGNRRR